MDILKAASKYVIAFHEERGDYDVKIGFVEKHSDGIIAVEVFYKWKLNGWEKNVHKIDHMVKGTDENWRVVEGLYTLEFSEHKTSVSEGENKNEKYQRYGCKGICLISR